jgi:signal transduction histidine kinase
MMDRRTISIDHMLEQLVAEYAGGFERNGLRLAADFECESLYADVDPEYMIRVFENLLSNSIRYGAKPGEVRITLRKIDGNIVIAISNKTGEIDKKELDRLFDKFYRLEKSRSEETGGTGLGLAIARKITELHGGKIWAEYSDGEITFRVVIPVVTAGVIRVTGDMGSTCP